MRTVMAIVSLSLAGALAGCAEPTGSEVGQQAQALYEDYPYGSCPDPDWFCAHGAPDHLGSVKTAACLSTSLFGGCDGAQVTVAAATDQGPFPREFYLRRGHGKVVPKSCIVTKERNTIVLSFQPGWIKCRTDLYTDDFVYHEHIASNPNSRCLGWVECRSDIPPEQVEQD